MERVRNFIQRVQSYKLNVRIQLHFQAMNAFTNCLLGVPHAVFPLHVSDVAKHRLIDAIRFGEKRERGKLKRDVVDGGNEANMLCEICGDDC